MRKKIREKKRSKSDASTGRRASRRAREVREPPRRRVGSPSTRTLRCAFYLFSLTLDMIPGHAMMARGQVRRGGNPLKGQSFVVSDDGDGLVELDKGCLYQTDGAGEAMLPVSPREDVNHPITPNEDDLIMDVELIDDGAFLRPQRHENRLQGVCSDANERNPRGA